MTEYYVSSHIRHCCVDDRIVILDLRTQQYIALPEEPSRAFQIVVSGAGQVDRVAQLNDRTRELIAGLITHGILTTSAPENPIAVPFAAAPTDSLMATPYVRPPPVSWARHLAAFLGAVLTVKTQFRAKTFHDFARRIQASKSSGRMHTADTCTVRELFRWFRWHRLWTYTASGICLFDSLVLMDFYRRHGVPTTLVLGVQSKPFGAHAWVQWQDVVLNDTVENVGRYTPIFTV